MISLKIPPTAFKVALPPSMEESQNAYPRYLAILFDRMLTHRTLIESTKLKCRKGPIALKAVATKGIDCIGD